MEIETIAYQYLEPRRYKSYGKSLCFYATIASKIN